MAAASLGNKWYDSVEGVRSSQASLEAFNKLVDERHKAGYEREENLRSFLVLGGKFRLDECGNVWRHIKDSWFSMEDNLPLPDLECRLCHGKWTIENIYDKVVWDEHKVIPLNDFVGKTLKDVKEHYHNLTDAVYRMQSDILIRNDKNIDLSPKYPDAKEDWKKDIVKNKRGWLSTENSITDDYVIQKGDEGHFNIWIYYHTVCNRKNLQKKTREKFRQIFATAGFKNIKTNATQNRYCGCDYCAPWFNVKTKYGNILIGWRKRVINIDWSGLTKREDRRLLHLFNGEDVTKEFAYIHAYGWDKAQDYLTRIHDYLEKNQSKNT